MRYFRGLLVVAFFIFTSCGTMRFNYTSDFATMNSAKDLEGYYLNRTYDMSILSCFNIREYADFVTVVSENPNEIKLIYYNDAGSAKQERIFKGKMKKKFFEIYFKKQQFFIPLIYSSCDIDRIRIGKSKDGKLLIRNFRNQSGNVLLLAGGYIYETPYKFSYSTEYKEYIPVLHHGLWGYDNLSGNTVIEPCRNTVIPAKYDFATIFENDVARVKLNEKWGLINKQGVEVIPLIYDEVIPFETFPPTFIVSVFRKKGMLDMNGNQLIPIIYDDMASSLSPQGLLRVRLNNEWKYISPHKF
jgi:hypothetical protein